MDVPHDEGGSQGRAPTFADYLPRHVSAAAAASRPAPRPFHDLWTLGYRRLVPIVPPDATISERSTMAKRPGARGKAVGVRNGDGTWQGFNWVKHEAVEADLDRWAAMGAGVGIKTGAQPDGTWLVAIDADTLNLTHATLIRIKVCDTFGMVPCRVGRAPKALYVVRIDGPLPYTRVEFDDGTGKDARVEILSEGRQFVASGVHPDTRMPYEWTVPLERFDALPVRSAAEIDSILAQLRGTLPACSEIIREGGTSAVAQETLVGPLALVLRAVELLPNTSALYPTRDAFVKVGYAIRASLPDHPDAALDAYHGWAARWTDGVNDPDVVDAEWRRMKPPYRIGAPWLLAEAEKHSGGRFDRAEQWFERPSEQSAPAGTTAPRFQFKTLQETADELGTSPSAWLVKGLLDQGAMSVLYGDSNTGKTFVMMALAYHIARGWSWAGLRVTQMDVAYVAAEGGKAISKRAAALKSKHGDAPGFFLLAASVDLYSPNADLRPLTEAIVRRHEVTGRKIGLVVLDTLARVMAGGDENSTKDMSAFIKNVDAIRDATGAHVCLVHHTGKDASKGARGSSALRAATDTEIEVADGRVHVTKQRDMDKEFTAAFVLEGVVLGLDEDGDPMTSCVAIMSAAPPVDRKKSATEKEESVLTGVRELVAEADQPTSSFPLRQIARLLWPNPSAQQFDRVRKHCNSLVKKGLLRKDGPGRYGLEVENSALSTRFLEPQADNLSVVDRKKAQNSLFD